MSAFKYREFCISALLILQGRTNISAVPKYLRNEYLVFIEFVFLIRCVALEWLDSA
jgi:hypothetical protein